MLRLAASRGALILAGLLGSGASWGQGAFATEVSDQMMLLARVAPASRPCPPATNVIACRLQAVKTSQYGVEVAEFVELLLDSELAKLRVASFIAVVAFACERESSPGFGAETRDALPKIAREDGTLSLFARLEHVPGFTRYRSELEDRLMIASPRATLKLASELLAKREARPLIDTFVADALLLRRTHCHQFSVAERTVASELMTAIVR